MPPVKGKMHLYTEEEMAKAVDDVRKHGVSVAAAAKNNNVPRSTLINQLSGKSPSERRMGPESILSKIEEGLLVKWLFSMARAGFPVTQTQLMDSVQKLIKELKRGNPFKDGRPGRKWFIGFCKRNPQVSNRMAQNLTKSRASVSEVGLKNWFTEIYDYLKEENLDHVLNHPERIFNVDEAAFFLNPKGNRVLVPRGEKNVYQIVNNDEKECLTVSLIGNASGVVGPTMIVFNYVRIPVDIAESVPKDWAIGKSESGWMTGELFFEYISNIFHPWLLAQKIETPVILFVDGHVSHLTIHTSEFCSRNGIILVALLPNATHLIQPMDVAVFRTLKGGWKESVKEWRQKNLDNPVLKKRHFAPLLEELIKEKVQENVLKNGFRKSGLYPWDPTAVDYSKIPKVTVVEDVGSKIVNKQLFTELNLRNGLICLEHYIGSVKLETFKNSGKEWSGGPSDESLFSVWTNMKKDFNISNTENGSDSHISGITKINDLVEDVSEVRVAESIEEEINLHDVVTIGVDTVESENNLDNDFITQNNFEKVSESGEVADLVIEDEDVVNLILSEAGIPITEILKTNENVPEVTNNCEDPVEPCQSTSEISANVDSVNNTTPSKKMNSNVPSPFKKALFWPDIKVKNKKIKEKIPSVATSEKWRIHHQKKIEAKLEEQRLKEERQKLRLLKRTLKQEDGKKRNGKKSRVSKRDYNCMTCDASWNEEKQSGINSKWIDCDNCTKSVHVRCLSKQHIIKFNLDDESWKNDEFDFVCEECDVDCDEN